MGNILEHIKKYKKFKKSVYKLIISRATKNDLAGRMRPAQPCSTRTIIGIATTIMASRFCVLLGKFLLVSSCPKSIRLLTQFYLRVNVAFAPLEVHQTWYFH